MKLQYLKTLWLLRFEKMKNLEEEAAWAYQEILDECLLEFGPEHEICRLLSQLVHEERTHEKMAESMLHLCHHTHPEVGGL